MFFTHRLLAPLSPLPPQDAGLAARIEEEEAARLAAARASMTPDQLSALVAATHELKERQETPDPPEALACVPGLQLSDIPSKITTVRPAAWRCLIHVP